MQSGNHLRGEEDQELVQIPAVRRTSRQVMIDAAKFTNRIVFTPLNDATGTLATVYGYTEVYALLVTGPNRLYFNILYFTPTLGPILLHALPFKPESKPHRLKVFQHIMHAALNSAFLSSSAQQVLLLLAGGADRGALIGGITAIQAGTTLLAIPCSYYDLKMREGRRYSAPAEGFLRYVMRPLQTAASLGMFLEIFNEHLHISPKWMPTAVGGGLGVARLGFEIINQCCHHKDGRAERFVEELIHEGFFNNLSASSVIFTVIASLYAARNAGIIPDEYFDIFVGVATTVFFLSMTGTIITYANNENQHNDENPNPDAENYQQLASSDEDNDSEEDQALPDNQNVRRASDIMNEVSPPRSPRAGSNPSSVDESNGALQFGLFASSNLASNIKILASRASMEVFTETTEHTPASLTQLKRRGKSE